MDASKPQSAKQLKEHLQDQQEPFSLQNYLIERSYMFKNCNNSDSSNTHRLYSAKNLNRSIRKRFLDATGILRSLLYKLIPTEDHHVLSSWDEESNSDRYYVHEITADILATQQTSEHFSFNRLGTVSDHFTNNDVEDKIMPYENHSSTLVNMFQTFTLPELRRSEVDIGTKPYWISSKENRQQYSKGSGWKEPLPNAVYHLRSKEAPVPVTPLSQKLVRDTVFSTYLRKLIVNSNILKFKRAKKDKLLHEMVETASLCPSNTRILRKREQLPFHCVQKEREFHKNEGKSLSIKAVSEPEDLLSIMQEHFNLLEEQYKQVKKISHLLHTEYSVTSSQEWKSFQIVDWEIHMEIGDAIIDDIVREIIDSF